LGGLIATASNPYWFLWWATIGAGYVVHSQNYGISGALFFFSGHILADFIWLSLLAVALVSGKRWLTDRFYQGIIFGLGLFLCAFPYIFSGRGYRCSLGGSCRFFSPCFSIVYETRLKVDTDEGIKPAVERAQQLCGVGDGSAGGNQKGVERGGDPGGH